MNRAESASKRTKLLRAMSKQSKKRPHVELLDSLIKRRSSITALNSDSHSSRSIVKASRRTFTETPGSCGRVPAFDPQPAPSFLPISSSRNAGPAPAFPLRAASIPPAARRAEFISVGGLRADRSALRSDMRPSKRTSGVAAATTRPHAPMNSSSAGLSGRLGFAHQPVTDPVRR